MSSPFSLYNTYQCPNCHLKQSYANTTSQIIVCDFCGFDIDRNSIKSSPTYANKRLRRAREIGTKRALK